MEGDEGHAMFRWKDPRVHMRLAPWSRSWTAKYRERKVTRQKTGDVLALASLDSDPCLALKWDAHSLQKLLVGLLLLHFPRYNAYGPFANKTSVFCCDNLCLDNDGRALVLSRGT